MTRVTKINIVPSSLELQEGTYGLVEACLEPSNATYADIVWTTDNSNIATVNSGHIVAKKRGTTKVKAVSLCDVSVKGECTLTVIQPKRVQGISFPKAEYTMTLGIPDYIFPNFTPSDALNKDLTWCGYDENIISVCDGLVTPKSAGTTTLMAVSTDGSYTASCTIRVVLDNVSIRKVGDYTEVHFEKGNKTWKYIGIDMVYDDDNASDLGFIEMLNDNFFRTDTLAIDQIYNYSYDELKFLYAIDPYGVSAYVNKYSELITRYEANCQGKDVHDEQLKYRDEMFRHIIGREPKYYRRVTPVEWEETTDKSKPHSILSESEMLFGYRKIYDDITDDAIQEMLLQVAWFALKQIPYVGDVLSSFEMIAQTYNIIAVTDDDYVINRLLDYYAQNGVEAYLEYDYGKKIFTWAHFIVDTLESLNKIHESTLVGSEFFKDILYYYSESAKFDLTMVLADGTPYKIQDIYEVIK